MKKINLVLGVALALCLGFAPVTSVLAKDKEKKPAEKEKAEAPASAPAAAPVHISKAQYPQPAWPADFKKVLDNPPADMQLYSLEPMESPESGDESLRGFKVLGKMFMRPEQAQSAVAAFNDAIDAWDSKKAKCFKPRQALVVKADGHLYEILLCYSCQQLFAYRDGEQVCSYGVAGSPKILKDILRKADKPLSTTDPKS